MSWESTINLFVSLFSQSWSFYRIFVASSSRSFWSLIFSDRLWPRSCCGLIFSVRLWPRSFCGLIFSVLILSIGFLWPPFALSLLIYAHCFAVGFLCHWFLVLWSVMTCSTSDRLSVSVGLLWSIVWLDSTGFEDSSCYDDTLKTRILDYLFYFLLVLSFFKSSAIAYALHSRGGVKEY